MVILVEGSRFSAEYASFSTVIFQVLAALGLLRQIAGPFAQSLFNSSEGRGKRSLRISLFH